MLCTGQPPFQGVSYETEEAGNVLGGQPHFRGSVDLLTSSSFQGASNLMIPTSFKERRYMDFLDKYIEQQLYEFRQRIAELESLIEEFPPETLQISRNGKYYNWKIVKPDGRRVYLKKDQENLAASLTRKETLEAELYDLKNKAAACEKYLKCRGHCAEKLEKLFSAKSPEFKRLLALSYKTKDQRVEDWLNEPYERSADYPDQLIVPTIIDNLYVRSKLEAGVAGTLYMLKIPCKYEKITKIGNINAAVDFTALDVRNMREIPIEVFGMMDNEDYRKYHRRKMNTYTNAGYIDSVNFIALYESSRSPLSPQAIRTRLNDFFFKNPPREL